MMATALNVAQVPRIFVESPIPEIPLEIFALIRDFLSDSERYEAALVSKAWHRHLVIVPLQTQLSKERKNFENLVEHFFDRSSEHPNVALLFATLAETRASPECPEGLHRTLMGLQRQLRDGLLIIPETHLPTLFTSPPILSENSYFSYATSLQVVKKICNLESLTSEADIELLFHQGVSELALEILLEHKKESDNVLVFFAATYRKFNRLVQSRDVVQKLDGKNRSKQLALICKQYLINKKYDRADEIAREVTIKQDLADALSTLPHPDFLDWALYLSSHSLSLEPMYPSSVLREGLMRCAANNTSSMATVLLVLPHCEPSLKDKTAKEKVLFLKELFKEPQSRDAVLVNSCKYCIAEKEYVVAAELVLFIERQVLINHVLDSIVSSMFSEKDNQVILITLSSLQSGVSFSLIERRLKALLAGQTDESVSQALGLFKTKEIREMLGEEDYLAIFRNIKTPILNFFAKKFATQHKNADVSFYEIIRLFFNLSDWPSLTQMESKLSSLKATLQVFYTILSTEFFKKDAKEDILSFNQINLPLVTKQCILRCALNQLSREGCHSEVEILLKGVDFVFEDYVT